MTQENQNNELNCICEKEMTLEEQEEKKNGMTLLKYRCTCGITAIIFKSLSGSKELFYYGVDKEVLKYIPGDE